MSRRRLSFLPAALTLSLGLLLGACSVEQEVHPVADTATVEQEALPPQARETLQRIHQGGPHPYRRDGALFHNREEHLPDRPTGYYRSYTVDTPGASTRGTRRIITGGDPPQVFYYTDDHYDSFRRIEGNDDE